MWTVKMVLIAFFSFGFINSCNETQDANSKNVIVKKQEKKPTKKKKKGIPKIVNENVVEILTEYGKEHDETIALIETDKGNIKVRLYKETPLHRANFVMLGNRNFYEETVFYRVEKGFIIQGGDSGGYDRRSLKRNVGQYSIPNEFQPERFYHKRGALSMTRDYDNNPDKRSSSYDFFIVVGTTYNDADLDQIEIDNNYTFTKAQREYYKTVGGAAHLDNQHTVLGEVLEGMDVVDEISKVEVDGKKWPVKDIYMNVKILK